MEMWLRFGIFITVFSTMVAWEFVSPQRDLSQSRQERWPTNLGITLLNVILVWATVGALAYMTATYAAEHQMGLLHWLSAPNWMAVPMTILSLDFALYIQHRLFHAIPFLWRFHRVHHADLGFDTTTGLRFHPFEIFLSLGCKAAVILALGAHAWAAIAFEVILNAASIFNHGNVSFSEKFDHYLRWFLVTPDMHRIHHSTQEEETHSNFGFSISWWDRVCGSYHCDPVLGQAGLEIGLPYYRDPFHLGQLLVLPFQQVTTWKVISPLELNKKLGEKHPPYVLDVRGLDEFTRELGHLEGAHLIPVADLETRMNELTPCRSQPLILV